MIRSPQHIDAINTVEYWGINTVAYLETSALPSPPCESTSHAPASGEFQKW